MSVYSKRNFNRFDQYVLISINDFIYAHVHGKHEICIRELVMRKEPLQQFETLFLKVPIIELQYLSKYNEG